MKICPKCRNSKFFYNQYHQDAFPEPYAMCKFCGYWEKEGEDSKQCVIFHHNCKGNKQTLPPTGHPRRGYCYTSNEEASEVSCEYCDEIIKTKAKWPVDDPNHPFHKL